MFDNRGRRVGKTEYVASAPDSLDLPRKTLFRQLSLKVDGIVDITDVTQVPVLYTGAIGAGLKLVPRVEIIANGRDTIKSISADALAMKNLYLYGTKPALTEPGLTVAAHPFGGVFMVPFAMPRSIREIDTLLPSGRLSTLELKVTYGSADAMFSTLPTAHTIIKCDVVVHLNESMRLDGKDEPYSSFKELYIEKTVTAASAAFQVILPVGNRYRGFLIECESDGNMVNTILNKISIKSGTDVFFSKDADVVQGENPIMLNLGAQTVTGYCYVDFCPEGRLVDALDATKLSSLEMELDVNVPGTIDKIRVYPCEIIAGAVI
ncbi:hypothetical protein ES707_11667 [subsurface metagenome]